MDETFFKKGREIVPLGVVKIIAVLHSIPFGGKLKSRVGLFMGVYSMSARASGKVLERRMCRLFLIRNFPPFFTQQETPPEVTIIQFQKSVL